MKPYAGVAGNLGDTVVGLLDRLVNQGHKLYMDNFYNSVKLSARLLENNTHVCGTMRKYRGEPLQIRNVSNAELNKGDVIAQQSDSVMCLAWRDKRIVKMISTCHTNTMTEVHVRQRGHRDRVVVQKPTCVVDYNKSMNGVDRIDQQIQYYPFVRKTVKWSKKFVIYLLQVSMHNAYTLYTCEFPNGGTKTLYDFILSVIRSWVKPNSTDDLPVADADNESDENVVTTPRAPFLDPPTRLDSKAGKHVMVKIVGTDKKKYPTRRCRVCIKRGSRGETRYICSYYTVPLHKGDCFASYHSLKHYH